MIRSLSKISIILALSIGLYSNSLDGLEIHNKNKYLLESRFHNKISALIKQAFPSITISNSIAAIASNTIPTVAWWKIIKSPLFCNSHPIPSSLAALGYSILSYAHYYAFAHLQASSSQINTHLFSSYLAYTFVYYIHSRQLDITSLIYSNNTHSWTAIVFMHAAMAMLYAQGAYLGIVA